MYYIILKDI